ncbi:hypothetical protein BT69DRAFT_1246115 [Atractiella rhizophila]|nr:hypothetical protein BT69DRAFT_1246115 [Atractiella rhizophila]
MAISVSLDVSNISKVLVVLGFYVSGLGLGSYIFKERLYLSEPLLCLCLGIAVGPIGLNWVNPFDWNDILRDGSEQDELTFQLSRIVVGIQVLFTGISLPKAYLRRSWQSLTILLLPVMAIAWLIVASIIVAIIPQLTFLEALVIAACVTPTDPVLSSSIVKGRFAEKHVPARVRDLILAESGANDGLGYPFIFCALFLIRHQKPDGTHNVGASIADWVVTTWIYQIVVSVVMGGLIGFIARISLKEAEKRRFIDQESFLAYGIGLAFWTMGTVGTLGSDDLLSCFIVGNIFTVNDWFRVETEDDSFQAVIDSLINVTVFVYIGAAMPWADFGNVGLHLSAAKLVAIAALLLTLRRPPWIVLFRKLIKELTVFKETAFLGFFGPVGVSAIYYVEVALEVLPEDRHLLRATIRPIVWFIVLSSVVAHGITVPMAHFGPKISRTLSISRTASWIPGTATPKDRVLTMSRTGSLPMTTEPRHIEKEEVLIHQSLPGSPARVERTEIIEEDHVEEGPAGKLEAGLTSTINEQETSPGSNLAIDKLATPDHQSNPEIATGGSNPKAGIELKTPSTPPQSTRTSTVNLQWDDGSSKMPPSRSGSAAPGSPSGSIRMSGKLAKDRVTFDIPSSEHNKEQVGKADENLATEKHASHSRGNSLSLGSPSSAIGAQLAKATKEHITFELPESTRNTQKNGDSALINGQ